LTNIFYFSSNNFLLSFPNIFGKMDFNNFFSLLQRGSGAPSRSVGTGVRRDGATSSRTADAGRGGPGSSRAVDAALLLTQNPHPAPSTQQAEQS
jgi:hypothetical protein